MKSFHAAALAVVLAGFGAASAPGQSVEDILSRVDANVSYASIRYSGRMQITIAGESRYKTMDALAQGSSKAFVEFTNPEDRGVRYLKRDKNLWIYFPSEQDTVKISGHLLKEGMMGSDVSYEDALESSDYRAKYSASLKQEDTVGDRRCFVVELTAKVDTAAYDRRVLWIDAERYVSLKQEMYAKSGRLLKVSNTLKVERLGDRWFPSSVEFVSKLRNNTKTVFTMSNVALDVAVDDRQFSMAALTK
ncbi:MAG: outer membrane lipoprotein-sorting protein [Spirochaetia bacterium]|jgi:outer membrane lipoprotein-sorting protein